MNDVTLYLGDCLEVMKGLPDGSVDAVFTDPPYDKASVPLYGYLAEHSARILKDGGFCWTYGGMIHPEVLSLMNKHLDYYWTFIMDITKTGSWARWWSKKIWVNYKPIFVFSKGKAKPLGWFDAIHGGDGKDKRYHEWGQSTGFAISALEYCTSEGDTILDPFMGGGTTGIACIETKRNFIGIEIDPKYFAIAEKRIQEAQMQLRMPV